MAGSPVYSTFTCPQKQPPVGMMRDSGELFWKDYIEMGIQVFGMFEVYTTPRKTQRRSAPLYTSGHHYHNQDLDFFHCLGTSGPLSSVESWGSATVSRSQAASTAVQTARGTEAGARKLGTNPRTRQYLILPFPHASWSIGSSPLPTTPDAAAAPIRLGPTHRKSNTTSNWATQIARFGRRLPLDPYRESVTWVARRKKGNSTSWTLLFPPTLTKDFKKART